MKRDGAARALWKAPGGAVVFALLAAATWLAGAGTGECDGGEARFRAGEQARYNLRWGMMNAGTATLKVLPDAVIKNTRARHFVLEVRSNGFVDLLYKVRDRYESYVDPTLNQSLFYRKVQSGKATREVTVDFDWNRKTAQYALFDRKREPIRLPDMALDPLSAVYKIRDLDLAEGGDIGFPITDGKKHFMQTGRILGKETLTLSCGRFDTYVITPEVSHFSGVFEKSDNPGMRVWISADKQQIPVKVKVNVFIGSVVAELESISVR